MNGTSRLLAIDPGTTESGFCVYAEGPVLEAGVMSNRDMITFIEQCRLSRFSVDSMAVEMVASYGMAVGKEVFETVRWIGRFQQAWHDPEAVQLIYRKDVKLHLCGSPRAKDANIRQALIDMYGGKEAAIGKKANPGPLYSVKSHAWPALAVAVTASAAMQPKALAA